MESRRSCVVIGGGLAGMVVTRHLAARGWSVKLLERSGRLGGKAGVRLCEGRWVEHGYHIFPGWYLNVRALLGELGITPIDFDRYHYLRPRGARRRLITMRSPSSVGAVLYNVFRGILPWHNMILFFYFLLQLLCRKLSHTRLLDRVSQVGLMRQAWCVTDTVAELNHENVLKASAIPAHDMSAMTTKKVMGYWLRTPRPFLSVLPGDLQTTFIEPLARTLNLPNVEIRLDTEVTGLHLGEGRVAAARVRRGDGAEEPVSGDVFVVCTPFEVARRWFDDGLYALDPELGNMQHLEAAPMAAFYLRLKRKLDVPREHVFVNGGRYGLSFIDLSSVWKDLPNTNSVLSFIASNYAPLAALSLQDATEELLKEIRQYLDIQDDDIEGSELCPNVDTPLFINTVGAWSNRPRHHTRVRNLYFAGDYVKNDIDLACMEGAVSSAVAAAACVLKRSGVTDVPRVCVPPTWPRWCLTAAWWLLLPLVVPVRLFAWCVQVSGADELTYSATQLQAVPRLERRREELARRRARVPWRALWRT